MKTIDMALIERKVKEGGWLTLSHLDSYQEPNGYVKADINEQGSGFYVIAQNLKSALLMAEKALIKSGRDDVELKSIVNAPDTNLDFLLRHGFKISVHSSVKEGSNYYHLTVTLENQEMFTTSSLVCNGILSVLQIAERDWAQYIMKCFESENAISYDHKNASNNF